VERNKRFLKDAISYCHKGKYTDYEIENFVHDFMFAFNNLVDREDQYDRKNFRVFFKDVWEVMALKAITMPEEEERNAVVRMLAYAQESQNQIVTG